MHYLLPIILTTTVAKWCVSTRARPMRMGDMAWLHCSSDAPIRNGRTAAPLPKALLPLEGARAAGQCTRPGVLAEAHGRTRATQLARAQAGEMHARADARCALQHRLLRQRNTRCCNRTWAPVAAGSAIC